MYLKIKKTDFIDNFLLPASKVTDTLTVDVEEGILKASASSEDNTVIFFGNTKAETDEDRKLVIPNIKTLLRLFQAVESDIELEVTSNSLDYKSKKISFKYHLLDEGMSQKKRFNEKKLETLEYNTVFEYTAVVHKDLLSLSSMLPGAEKCYFLTEETQVMAEVGDKSIHNTNEAKIPISDSYEGESLDGSFVLAVGSLNVLSFAGKSLKVSLNSELKLALFEQKLQENINFKYIVSGLVK